MEKNKIYNEDCLEGMKRIADGVIDMICCDLPYGKLNNEWDKRLEMKKLWEEYRRIIKSTGVIALFGNGQFEIELASAALDIFKYKYVWVKNTVANFINCKNRPMIKHEDIMIFSKGTAANRGKNNMTYKPQGLKVYGKICHNGNRKFGTITGERPCNKKYEEYEREYTNYPSDVLFFDTPPTTKRVHTSQKPVELLEYLIKTYTNEGELVLDNCMGSGSTAVACVNTNRNFIGFEIDAKYCEVARKRINEAMGKMEMMKE